MQSPKRYLKYLIKFYEKSGLDVDYVDALDHASASFLCNFILENYGGMTDDINLKKKANHHRYASDNDALVCKTVASSCDWLDKTEGYFIDPEAYLLTKELMIKKFKK